MAFTQLMSVGAVPPVWKTAIITPVFKKGTAGNVNNYRPISLTCVPCKIMERIISQKIYQHFINNNVLHHAQHGFLKGRSTCTALLESMNDWTLSVQYKRLTTVIYVDFKKAFDTVSHEKLFIRLASYGVTGALLQWLRNFLTGRTHRTRVGSSLSPETDLISGVIQGSGIGPLLFLTFINELASIMESYGIKIKLFADDSKMYADIIEINDITRLQAALDHLVKWATTWQLQIAIDKCCVLNIGRSHLATSTPLSQPTFTIHGQLLPVVRSCRDLGVIISDNLLPRDHINSIVAKASQRANAIMRCFLCRDTGVLLQAFKVYVRPLLEFCTPVWSPVLKKDITAIEQVQRRFTKRLPTLKELTYSERLHVLNLESLELRRLHLDLALCYQIIFGLVGLKSDDFFTFNSRSTTRGHQFKLLKQHSYGVRCHFFTNRIIDIWNFLPVNIIDFSSLGAFKRSLKFIDFSQFLSFC